MLDNEPTGGSVVGENPTADAVETTKPAQKPARRRATRRTAPPAPAADTDLTSENAESTAAEPAKAPAKRASRARKKAVPTPDAEPAAGPTPSVETGTAADAVPIPDAEAADTAGQPAKKVAKRTTRSRKKAAPPAEPVTDEPVTVELGAAPTPAADAAKVEDEQAEPAAQGQPASAPAMAAPPVVMFMAPDPVAAKPPTPVVATPFAPGDDEETPAPTKRSRSRRRSAAAAEPEPIPAEEPTEVAGEVPEGESAEEDDESAERRRRRRGRRGRGRGRGGEESDSDETTEDGAEDTAAEADEESDETRDGAEEAAEGGTRRRRRRRRRGSAGGDDQAPDDPPNTVVRVREPAPAATRSSFDDEVQGVKGSTRLEAKRQRRRDGRDQSRRRPPVLSEAEFLARREAVERVMVVRQLGERTQIAVLEDDVLVEHYVTKASSASYAGNVYLGKVQNVLPSMEAAFVDIGKGRNAVLYAGEVNWDSAGMAGKPRKIEQALKSGDAVLVQVTKDPIGHKGARLTSQISLPGRFLVYVPEGQMTGISRKLPENERKRLKDILKKIVPENAGVIIRTAAEGASEEELSRDVARLEAQWQSIKTKSEKGGAPALLHAEPDLVIRVIRDIFNEDFTKLIVQGNEAWDTVEQYVAHVSPDLVERLSRHTGESDVFHDLRIDEQLTKALDRKVWLPSGGSLVIDRTEAMTVVDVNTGKFTGQGGNLEETVTRNNLEAAEEIVRQLRLRDIGGIIVIDFIDMVLEGNRDLVLRRLTECLGRDRTKHQVAEVTSLGLVQMTRKRVGQGLLEVFSEVCEHCRGRGIIIRSEPVGERPKPVLPVAATATAEPKSRKRRGRGRGGDVEPVEPAPVPAVVTAATTDGAPAHPDEAAPIEHVAAVPVEHVAAVPVEHVAADRAAPTGHAAAAEADGRPVVQVAGVEPASVEPAAPSVNGAAPDGQPVRERNGVHPPAAEPPATEPVEQREPATAVPAPRKRARRAASRPAGPPVVD